jgi:hypothetical protein
MLPRLGAATRRRGELVVEGLPVPDAPPHELGPLGNHRERVLPLRKQSPERGVMPAELMMAAVAMRADALPQPSDFGDQLVARHPLQVFVHGVQCSAGLPGMMMVLP